MLKEEELKGRGGRKEEEMKRRKYDVCEGRGVEKRKK